MQERTLLERLREPDGGASRSSEPDPGRIIQSVLQHLGRMFNTRQGHALAALDYGMPDLTDFMREYPASAQSLERAIREGIESYEPRLKSVRVRLERSEADVLVLTFRVRAKLALKGAGPDVSFAMNLDADGHFQVRE